MGLYLTRSETAGARASLGLDWIHVSAAAAWLVEARTKAGPHRGETEAAGEKAQQRQRPGLPRSMREQVGLSQSGKIHKLGLVHQVCLSPQFMHKWPELKVDRWVGAMAQRPYGPTGGRGLYL